MERKFVIFKDLTNHQLYFIFYKEFFNSRMSKKLRVIYRKSVVIQSKRSNSFWFTFVHFFRIVEIIKVLATQNLFLS